MIRVLLAFVIFTPSLALASQLYSNPVYRGSQVKKWLDDLSKFKPSATLKADHPDYPMVKAIEALKADRVRNHRKVIQILEDILPQIKYSGLKKKRGPESISLIVGGVGSHHLWRDLMYLLLGRAYYETERDEESVAYLEAIKEDSALFPVAGIAKTWSLLRLGEFKDAESYIEKLRKVSPVAHRGEITLQEAFLNLQTRNYKKAILIARPLKLNKGITSGSLIAIRAKILAQAYLEEYIARSNDLNFKEKQGYLNQVLQFSEQIPKRHRNSDFAFLVAETYWSLASVLRIENPSKYARKAKNALIKANEWITPWIDKSLKANKPLLSEDALFFGVAVLWEQDKFSQAIERLLVLPRFFPQGRFRPDVYQLLADYYFEKTRFKSAIRYYRLLAGLGSEEKSAYGVYKAAWSFYNLEEKWKALRHLERLVLHYRKTLGEDAEPPPGSLVKEAKQDMVLMLAEMMPFKRALKEFKIFGFGRVEGIGAEEKLAESYKKIGKYEDSIGVWRSLLNRAPGTIEAFNWFEQLLYTVLASGNRLLLSHTIDFYFPKLRARGSEPEKHTELEKQLVKLVLTVHREARKTDDRDIWKATDALYTSFMKAYPESTEGDIWYYGAQRKERKGRRWEAVEFYKKASRLEKYENAKDSSLTVLKLIKEAADKESLKAKADRGVYKKISDAAIWYIDSFPKTKQKGLAEYLLLEAYQRSSRLTKAKEFLITTLKRDGFTKEHKEQYLKHNSVLYKEKKWAAAFELATDVLKTAEDENAPKKFRAKVAKFVQESAFQSAFAFDRTRGKSVDAKRNLALAREWYRKAIESPIEDKLVELKAWHNYLLTFKGKKNAEEYVRQYKEFGEKYKVPKRVNSEKKRLLYAIYSNAAFAWDVLGSPIDKAASLTSGIRYSLDPKRTEALRWETAVLYGTYYEKKRMKEAFQRLKKAKSKFATKRQNQITYARLLFWNGELRDSWSRAKRFASIAKPEAGVYLLIRDLFSQSKTVDKRLYVEIRKHLLANRAKFQGTPILKPIWAELVSPKFDVNAIAKWSFSKGRSLAGLFAQPKKGASASVRLKQRLGAVSKILNELGRQKEVLRKYVKSGAPQVSLTSLCSAPRVTKGAAKLLGKLSKPKIKSKQWPAFLKRLKGKVRELTRVAQKEKRLCLSQRQANLFLPPVRRVASPLCSDATCFPLEPSDSDAVVSLEKNWKITDVSRLEKVYQYLKIGAWATAEYLAYGAKSVQERSLLLGLIRIAQGDSWNAASFLKEAGKDRKLRSHSRLFEARTVYRHGYTEMASNYMQAVNTKELLPWEKSLYSDLLEGIAEKRARDRLRRNESEDYDSDLDYGFEYSLY